MMKVGLLNKDEVQEIRNVIGSFSIDQLGDKIYQLPNGQICGQDGWDKFNRAIKFNIINSSRGY